MGYRVSIDIGGTFTDCVVVDEAGLQRIFKTPSTPGEFERGFMNAISLAAAAHDLSVDTFLTNTDRIVHGTTVATNALIEGKIPRVGLICNEGFRDILTLREAPRKQPFRWRVDYPEPFVPRARTFGVQGRINASGEELIPLDESGIHSAIDAFRSIKVESVAVCLLWSIINGAHEQRIREIIKEAWPTLPVTLSHELNPIAREYRRTISSVIDAALQPIVSIYVSRLEAVLRKSGYTNALMIANSLGGMMPPEEIQKKPIYSVMSGPTLAPMAAKRICDEPDLVVVDMGGTSFDVSAIRGGQVIVSPEAMITEFDMLGMPKMDVRSVGAGGGSIAWVDAGGWLRVGPESVGASPGPACYGSGGVKPTVTDANVVLGLIDPDYFLGGRMKLDKVAAETAVQGIANSLGVSLLDAAYAIHSTVSHNMIAAIEDITIKEGIDPRESYFVSGGGATACHMAEMARALDIKRFLIPKFSAGLSAFGGLISDIAWEEKATLVTDATNFSLEKTNKLLKSLRRQGTDFLSRSNVDRKDWRFEYSFLGRYQYQSWEIEVPFVLPNGELLRTEIEQLIEQFHAMHERIYTVKNVEDLVEFTTWKVRAIGANNIFETSLSPESVTDSGGSPIKRGGRQAYLPDAGGLLELPVYNGTDVDPGNIIEGPALIEEETMTILLPPDAVARTNILGNYLVNL